MSDSRRSAHTEVTAMNVSDSVDLVAENVGFQFVNFFPGMNFKDWGKHGKMNFW